MEYDALQTSMLSALAGKYIWWETPEKAMAYPRRVIAQVMNLGTFEDVQTLKSVCSQDMLREVVSNAEAGWFDAQSWTYWHYILGLAETDCVQPLPQRTFA